MKLFAISGVKNSGKTTLVCRLLEIFAEKGVRAATIKHDGHEFTADVPGTDTWKHLQSGAYGTAVFSEQKCMIVKQQPGITEEQLMKCFPEAELILLEGFKYSDYPKIEVIRKGNSLQSVCREHHLTAIATDYSEEELREQDAALFRDETHPPMLFDLNKPEKIAEFILQFQE